MQLRDYQQKAHDAIFAEWEEKGTQRTLLVLPTGCGKTIVFAKVAEDCVKKGDKVGTIDIIENVYKIALDDVQLQDLIEKSYEKIINLKL